VDRKFYKVFPKILEKLVTKPFNNLNFDCQVCPKFSCGLKCSSISKILYNYAIAMCKQILLVMTNAMVIRDLKYVNLKTTLNNYVRLEMWHTTKE